VGRWWKRGAENATEPGEREADEDAVPFGPYDQGAREADEAPYDLLPVDSPVESPHGS
jgi:hypothetical protein